MNEEPKWVTYDQVVAIHSRQLRRFGGAPGLRDDGMLLVALPAPDDLIELRSHAGQPGPDRVARTVETFAGDFTLVDKRRVSTTADLDAAAVHDVLHSIYRPLRSKPAEAMRVTFSLDLLLFRTFLKG